jgi:hypothetical protein
MKKESKAALLSAFVIPGAGHVFLKKYPIALGFIGAYVYLLVTLIGIISDILQTIMLKINNGDIALTIDAITQAVSAQVNDLPDNYNYISYALLLIWGFAIFDAYRLGRKNSVSEK